MLDLLGCTNMDDNIYIMCPDIIEFFRMRDYLIRQGLEFRENERVGIARTKNYLRVCETYFENIGIVEFLKCTKL